MSINLLRKHNKLACNNLARQADLSVSSTGKETDRPSSNPRIALRLAEKERRVSTSARQAFARTQRFLQNRIGHADPERWHCIPKSAASFHWPALWEQRHRPSASHVLWGTVLSICRWNIKKDGSPLKDILRRQAFFSARRIAMRGSTALAIFALVGCDGFPKDIAGTMKEITQSGVLHAGLVADGAAERQERDLAQTIAEAAGVEAELETGSAASLLHDLEDGKLDLVVGEFAKASPWKKKVALSKAAIPGAKPDKHQPVLRAAIRKGENAWFLFVSRTIERGGLR